MSGSLGGRRLRLIEILLSVIYNQGEFREAKLYSKLQPRSIPVLFEICSGPSGRLTTWVVFNLLPVFRRARL